MPGLGDEFRAAREARHLSLSDVSEQIHIRSVYLQSIENEEWSVIAAPVYVRGFVRTYARFLGLDPEHAVSLFNSSIGELAGPREPAALPAIDRPRRPSKWLITAGVVALLLIAFVGYRFFQFQQDGGSSTTVADATDAPSVAASASARASADPGGPTAGGDTPVKPSAAPQAKHDTLELSVSSPSWLLVRVDGAQVLQGIMPAGTHKSFHGNEAFVRAGNAGGVSLTIDGKDQGPMGHSGAVVQRQITLSATE